MSLSIYLIAKEDIDKDNFDELYSTNITHNLTEMAKECDLYFALWHSQNINTASDLIPKLDAGIAELLDNPAYYKAFDDKNDWGTYLQFVPWLIKLRTACKKYSNSIVKISK